MKTYKLSAINEVMVGCLNNDYNSIVRASYLLREFIHGADVDCDERDKRFIKESLYRKYMRACSRVILNNPRLATDLAIDCGFSSMVGGEYTGIHY